MDSAVDPRSFVFAPHGTLWHYYWRPWTMPCIVVDPPKAPHGTLSGTTCLGTATQFHVKYEHLLDCRSPVPQTAVCQMFAIA